jgi:hypothetical protein
MKNVFLSLAFMLIGSFAFANTNGNNSSNVEVTLIERDSKYSIVTEDEYNNATEFEKRMINQIDAAIAALDVLNKNKDNSNLSAIVSISKNVKNNFSNAIIISKIENNKEEITFSGSCSVCGVRSAYSCLKKLEADDSLGNTFDVHVTRQSNGCVSLTW